MGRMRGIIEEPTGLRYVPSLHSEDQGRDLLEHVRRLEFDEVRMQAAKYCHGSARSNSDRPATLAKSADVAKRGRPSVGGPICATPYSCWWERSCERRQRSPIGIGGRLLAPSGRLRGRLSGSMLPVPAL
jgi:hypothetical protein